MTANENQIVVYQPNETVRLDVRLENETVWLTQSQMATLFGCSTDNIGLHLKNVFAVGELSREARMLLLPDAITSSASWGGATWRRERTGNVSQDHIILI